MAPFFSRSGLAGVALSLLVFGCVAQPTNTLTPGYEGAPGVERFLVCAPNLALSLPAELHGGTAPLQQELEAYLRQHGREVGRLNLYDGRLLWKRSIAAAKQEGAIGNAVAIFTTKLAKHFDFQALVMPSILLHTARTSSSAATWDGVRRRMKVVNLPGRAVGGRGQDTLADGIALGGMSGEMAVTSVHLMVFTRSGERIFEGRGGLDFIHEIDMSRLSASYDFDFRLRTDLFLNREVLREGIEIAFTPYLTPPVAP